jgi:hypothetical protein
MDALHYIMTILVASSDSSEKKRRLPSNPAGLLVQLQMVPSVLLERFVVRSLVSCMSSDNPISPPMMGRGR